MFGVEARKYFNMNDGMKMEAFRQQQRHVDQEKKTTKFKNEIVKQIEELKQVNQ